MSEIKNGMLGLYGEAWKFEELGFKELRKIYLQRLALIKLPVIKISF